MRRTPATARPSSGRARPAARTWVVQGPAVIGRVPAACTVGASERRTGGARRASVRAGVRACPCVASMRVLRDGKFLSRPELSRCRPEDPDRRASSSREAVPGAEVVVGMARWVQQPRLPCVGSAPSAPRSGRVSCSSSALGPPSYRDRARPGHHDGRPERSGMARFCLRRAALASGCVTTRPTTDSRVIRQAPARAGRGPLHHRFRRPQYRQPGSPSTLNRWWITPPRELRYAPRWVYTTPLGLPVVPDV